jgi:hypothetical protein
MPFGAECARAREDGSSLSASTRTCLHSTPQRISVSRGFLSARIQRCWKWRSLAERSCASPISLRRRYCRWTAVRLRRSNLRLIRTRTYQRPSRWPAIGLVATRWHRKRSVLEHHCGTRWDSRLEQLRNSIAKVHEVGFSFEPPPMPSALADYWVAVHAARVANRL